MPVNRLKTLTATIAAVGALALTGTTALAAANTVTLEFLGNGFVLVNGVSTPMNAALQAQQTECQTIINTPATGNLTKTFTGFFQNGSSFTYNYHYTSTGAPPFETMTDCLFDVNTGTIITRVDETPPSPSSQDNDTSAPIQNHFSDLICDRIRLQGPNGPDEYSNLLGVQNGHVAAGCEPSTGVPEAPAAGLILGIGGATALGAVWFVRRRRSNSPHAAGRPS